MSWTCSKVWMWKRKYYHITFGNFMDSFKRDSCKISLDILKDFFSLLVWHYTLWSFNVYLVSLCNLAKTPLLGSHWKYRTPATEPSFFPEWSSRTTPAQSPGENWVSPRYWMYPGFVPFTHTLSPIMKSSVLLVRISSEKQETMNK